LAGDERPGQSFQYAGLDKIRGPGVNVGLRGKPRVQNRIGFIGADGLQRGNDSERKKELSEYFYFCFSSGQIGTK
jgi:hypothetical protein